MFVCQFLFLNQVYGLKQDKVSLSCVKNCFGHFSTLIFFVPALCLAATERPQHCALVVLGTTFDVLFQKKVCV